MSLVYDSLFNVTANYTGTFGTSALSASNLKAGGVFRSNGKQVTKVIINIASITSPPVYQVSLQGLSAAATPNGTDLGGGSPTLTTFTPSAGINTITLTNPYTPTLGDVVSVVMEYSSGTIDASHTTSINIRLGASNLMIPCPLTYNGTTWANNTGQTPGIGAIYSDGSYPLMNFPPTAGTQINYNTGSATKEYGIHFVPDSNYTIDRLLVWTANNAGNGQITIYDSSNNILTGGDNVTVTSLSAAGAPVASGVIVPITPITLTSGVDYYMAFGALNGSNIRIYKYVFTSQASKEAVCGKANFVSRASVGSGAWTEDSASFIPMTPLISGLSRTSGGASS